VKKQEIQYHLAKIVSRERDMVILGSKESWPCGRLKTTESVREGAVPLARFYKVLLMKKKGLGSHWSCE